MIDTTFAVDGMACDGCETAVTDALEELDGVRTVDADNEGGDVRVVYDDAAVGRETLARTIEGAGYDVLE